MPYTRKRYRNGRTRGGIKGSKVNTAFGAPGNKHTSPRKYPSGQAAQPQ